MPLTDWGWLITPGELRSWIVLERDDILVINKPGLVVCHPSKQGPWSSLVGACREYLGAERLHMPSRLDRETSGVVVFARDHATARLLQMAIEHRRVKKTYLAILDGDLAEPRVVSEPIEREEGGAFYSRQCVRPDGRAAETVFTPVARGGGYTLARVEPRTGRLHQIRVHAAWMGHAVAGDKLYGPDPTLMSEFIREGFTTRVTAALPIRRQALHAAAIEFEGLERFAAAPAGDMVAFARERMDLALEGLFPEA